MTAKRFTAALGCPLRQATVEDVRQAIERITVGATTSTARQYIQRVKSLLGYALSPIQRRRRHQAAQGNQSDRQAHRARVGHPGSHPSTRNKRDRILLAVTYVAGLRVSEVVALNCADIIERSDGRLQLHILGKGGKERDILLPASLGPLLRELCEGRAPGDPVFRSRKGDQRLTDRAVNYLVKRLALPAGINPKLSAHWLRHAHASHALDRGAPLSLVTGTLGHANVATTSVYLHAKPGTSSGDQLDPDVRAAK